MRFSLIMCTLGRREELIAFFDSLRRQKRDDFEMIVVDQNKDDRLVDLLAGYAKEFPLKHVRMNARGASRARNFGIAYATGELFCFPDDDCEYLDGYLDRLDELFRSNPNIDAITSLPVADRSIVQGDEWNKVSQQLDCRSVLDRCQEFTIVVRRESLGNVRFNDFLGVGAGTPWGAEEAPDFLIGLMNNGQRVDYYPQYFIYHPKKAFVFSRALMHRASSYAAGRGCFLRLHNFPLRTAARNIFRPLAGSLVYLVLLKPQRSVYYLAVVYGLCRGMLVSRAELERIRGQTTTITDYSGTTEGVLYASH
jgi:glycosyltransferase involved in cell wall biosynthesis